MTLQELLFIVHTDAQASFHRLRPERIVMGSRYEVTVTASVRAVTVPETGAHEIHVCEGGEEATASVSVTLPLEVKV